MISRAQVHSLTGQDVYDRDGDKIGTVGQVWEDAAGQPAWASVQTGFFGTKETLVPLESADLQGDRLTVPFEKRHVKDAPNVDTSYDEALSGDEVDRLSTHYGLSWEDTYRSDQSGGVGGAASHGDADATYAGGQQGEGFSTAGYDPPDPGTEDAMTRSEERLNVGTEREQAGKARLRKYAVSEQQQLDVPVSRDPS